MEKEDLIIKQEWIDELHNAMKENAPGRINNYIVKPWTPAELDFMCNYYGRFWPDGSRIKAKHIAWALKRPLGSIHNKALALQCAGKITSGQVVGLPEATK